MIDFQQKRRIKNIIYSKAFFVFLLILTVFLGRSTYDIYEKSKLSYDNYIRVKRNYDDLVSRKAMLESEITRLKTDGGIEEEIRSKFSVGRPGETVVTIIDIDSSSTSESVPDNGFWSKLWSFFQ